MEIFKSVERIKLRIYLHLNTQPATFMKLMKSTKKNIITK